MLVSIRRSKKKSLGLDMAPLIDMVFLLLIFFMLSAHFIEETGISLELPQSKVAGASRPTPLTVSIDRQGRVFVDEVEVGLRDLRQALQMRLAETSRKEVVVKSDRDCLVQILVSVMDEIRLAGARGLLLSAEGKDR
ncbi:MAG: biopolymer transporter ExbD [Deltaproteobacteria bacterium]|nr:MAG: biopolymer transporter ExbD [Deltaproteobacteria bacterium]